MTEFATAKQLEQQFTLPVYPQLDFEPVRGEGAWLIDANGRRLLDMYGGHAVAVLGYNHPALLDAVKAQITTLPFQSNAVALDVRAAAARKLVNFAPAQISHAFFVNSGAEANENALRLAFLATGRKRVVAVEHGFHGRTAAAAAVTWGSAKRWYAFPNLPFDVHFVPRNDIEAALRSCDAETAAVIVEPVQGVAGAFDLDRQFLQALATSAREAGALFIADEVQSGMGRCGTAFSIEHADVDADIITAAKSLGGGLPCGAVLTTPAIADVCRFGDLGTTFGGGPLAAAAINAVIDTINDDGLIANAREREAQIRATCVTGPVKAVQGRGLLTGLVCEPAAKLVRNALLEQNILTGTSGDPHVVRLLAPLTIGEADIAILAAALKNINSDGTYEKV
ncbi:MAG: aminotransferase class III-fold pyridoxal phosphate-dependent enzyme [Pseudomonadota bacterium]